MQARATMTSRPCPFIFKDCGIFQFSATTVEPTVNFQLSILNFQFNVPSVYLLYGFYVPFSFLRHLPCCYSTVHPLFSYSTLENSWRTVGKQLEKYRKNTERSPKDHWDYSLVTGCPFEHVLGKGVIPMWLQYAFIPSR